MSIYVMTVGDLAKKRGEPVGDFVKKVQQAGFEAGSHAKKLTQQDLDTLIGLLDGNVSSESRLEVATNKEVKIQNPNVLMVTLPNNKKSILFVDATINDSGKIDIRIIESSTEDSLGDSLLEFRRQLGMKLGVN